MNYRVASLEDLEIFTQRYIEFKDEHTEYLPDHIQGFRVENKPLEKKDEMRSEKIRNTNRIITINTNPAHKIYQEK